MTITVTMSKEEFLEWNEYKKFKSNIKCGIIDLNSNINSLMKIMLDDGIWVDKNKYDKQLKLINASISNLERGIEDADTNM